MAEGARVRLCWGAPPGTLHRERPEARQPSRVQDLASLSSVSLTLESVQAVITKAI